MIQVDERLRPADLVTAVETLFELSGSKILTLEERWQTGAGAPVFTREGRYGARGWTDWTQGFQFGSALLQYEVTRDETFLEIGRAHTLAHMAHHVTHRGVHDHGFNVGSTYGNLLRQMAEGLLPTDPWERSFYELALKASGAVQASRWTQLPDGLGFVHSFNGPHSLFADTIRSMRVLALADRLEHVLLEERDERVDLLERLLCHAEATARYNVYFGLGRDEFDVRGRVAHESVFDIVDGSYRCPSSQQGYSPFTTWTRGLAWILCGFAELLEHLDTVADVRFQSRGGKPEVMERFRDVAEAVGDYYVESSAADGIPFWDTGAPDLPALGNWGERPADPFNDHEPVDSSAAAIAAQGLLRLGRYLLHHGEGERGRRFFQAGLTVARTLFAEPYLATDPKHEGLLLHAVYHVPSGWDHVPPGRRIPCGEATMWGDYHARELALLLLREARGQPWLQFFAIDFD